MPITLTKVRQSLAPLVYTFLGVILITACFWNANGIHNNWDKECSTEVDADVSGVGVRASIWIQIGTLILISTMGFFHEGGTGIKEVGGGLILTHVSFTVALIVQILTRKLTSVDAALGAAFLDAQNLALLIVPTAKETLAARWQVLLLTPAQLMGLIVLPILVTGLNNGTFASEDCKCLRIFWWSRLSDCDTFPTGETSVFWGYYTLRLIMWLQSITHSLYNAPYFHKSERAVRNPVSTRGSYDTPEPVLVWKATIEAGFSYAEYPATISTSYMIYTLYCLTSMVVAEVTIRDYKLQGASDVRSVGQIMAIVIAIATFLRAAWSFQILFNEEEDRSSFPDFVFGLIPGPWNDHGTQSHVVQNGQTSVIRYVVSMLT